MTENFASFELVFSQPKTREFRPVRFVIDEHSLAQRWAGMLKELLQQESHLEKNYLFHGWINGDRNLEYLCVEMNRQIQIINQTFAHMDSDLYYHISQVFSPALLNQDELNKIHKDFEILIGQSWAMSKYYLHAAPEGQTAIRQINQLCHEMENYLQGVQNFAHGQCSACMIAAMYPKITQPLQPEDRQYFRLFNQFGDVYLHYAQLGKNHLEAFYGHDDIVSDNNLTSLRFLSGEFDIHLSDFWDSNYQKDFSERFYSWLAHKGIDPEEHNLGTAKVAGLDRNQFVGMTPFEILKELFRYTDVREIILHSDQGTYRHAYSYLWNDSHIAEVQQHFAEKKSKSPMDFLTQKS